MIFITDETDHRAYFFAENEDDERRLAVIENVLLVAGVHAAKVPVGGGSDGNCVEVLTDNVTR